jgi:protein tyrosine phosphatase (PTP) superfamily phosphohydrolase (DUF442 family)
MSILDIYNIIELDDGTALAGMPTADQCRDIAAAGFAVVINLAPEDAEGALPDEARVWSDLGITYRNIPVPWSAPALDHYDSFVAAMDEFVGAKAFIHCQANFRVTAFYAAYAVGALGWSRQQAQELIDRIWLSRDDYVMDDAWKSFVAAAMDRASQTTTVPG